MVPATACSVTGNYLIERHNAVFLPSQDVIRGGHLVLEKKHNSIPQLLKHGLISNDVKEDFLVFATVRNPFDRMVSYYQRMAGGWSDYQKEFSKRKYERLKKDLTKEQLLAWKTINDKKQKNNDRRTKVVRIIGFNAWFIGTLIRWKIQYYLYGDSFSRKIFPLLDGVDTVVRYEQLEKELSQLLNEDVALPIRNKTHGKTDYRLYYNRFSRFIGSALMRKDLAKQNYSFDGIL